MSTLAMAGLAGLAIGLALLLAGIVIALRKAAFTRRAVRTTGTVTACERDSRMEGGYVYTPTVRFTAADGREQEYTPGVATSYANFTVGESVGVLYDPREAGSVMLGKPGSLRFWFGALVLIVTGLAFGLIGGVLVLLGEGRGYELLGLLF